MCAIDNGFPVMSLRTKNHRFNAVVGYDNDGGTILYKEGVGGANNEHVCKTVSLDQWEETISDYILLKENSRRIPNAFVFLCVAETDRFPCKRIDKINGKMLVGFAAWDAYLDMLENEDLSRLSNDEVGDILGQYCDGLCQIWGRNSGLAYYRSVSGRFPNGKLSWRQRRQRSMHARTTAAFYGRRASAG